MTTLKDKALALTSDYQLLTEKELSTLLKISVSKIQKDRLKKGSIPFILLGKCIRYRLSDVLAHLEAHTYQSTSQVTAGA